MGITSQKLFTIDAAAGKYSVQINSVFQGVAAVQITIPWFPTVYFGGEDVFNPIGVQNNVILPAFQSVDFSFDFDDFNQNVAGKSTCGRMMLWTEDSGKAWFFDAPFGCKNGITAGLALGSNIVSGHLPLDCASKSSKIHIAKIWDNDQLVSGQGVFTFNTFHGQGFLGST